MQRAVCEHIYQEHGPCVHRTLARLLCRRPLSCPVGLYVGVPDAACAPTWWGACLWLGPGHLLLFLFSQKRRTHDDSDNHNDNDKNNNKASSSSTAEARMAGWTERMAVEDALEASTKDCQAHVFKHHLNFRVWVQ